MNSSLMIDYAKTFLGHPYIWGAKKIVNTEIFGLDCSGFVMACLEAMGILHGEFNAQEIYEKLLPKASLSLGPGTILCFGANGHIGHVAIALSVEHMIECGGGDHTTTNQALARMRDACVRIRPISHRKDLYAYLTII